MIGFSRWDTHTTHPKGICCSTVEHESSGMRQAPHSTAAYTNPPSWKSVTFLGQLHLQSFSTHLYLSHVHFMYLPMLSLCISLSLVTSQLLTGITVDFSFVFIFCIFENLATNQYYAFHSVLYFEKFYWNCLSSVFQTMKIKHGSCITEI